MRRFTEAMVMDRDAQTITHIDYTDRASMVATAKEYAEALRQGMQMAGGETMGKEMEEQLKNLPPERRRALEAMKDGYPVRSIEKGGASTTEVTQAENRSIGAAEFQPPAGFARKTLQEMMGGK